MRSLVIGIVVLYVGYPLLQFGYDLLLLTVRIIVRYYGTVGQCYEILQSEIDTYAAWRAAAASICLNSNIVERLKIALNT